MLAELLVATQLLTATAVVVEHNDRVAQDKVITTKLNKLESAVATNQEALLQIMKRDK